MGTQLAAFTARKQQPACAHRLPRFRDWSAQSREHERAVEERAKTLLVLTPNYVQSEVTNFEALFLVDYHLEVVFGTTCRRENTRRRDVPPGRLYRCHFQPVVSTTDLLSDARQHLAVAKEMIEQMGYGRRKSEVEALQRDLAIVK